MTIALRTEVWRCETCGRTVDVRHVEPGVTPSCHGVAAMHRVKVRTSADSDKHFEQIEDEAAAEAAEGGR